MTPLATVAVLEGLAILGLLYLATWLLDKIDAERQQTIRWREECRAWEFRARHRERRAYVAQHQ